MTSKLEQSCSNPAKLRLALSFVHRSLNRESGIYIFGGISRLFSHSSCLFLVAAAPGVSQVMLVDMAGVVTVFFEVFRHLYAVDGLHALRRRGVKAEGNWTISVLVICHLVLSLIRYRNSTSQNMGPVCSGAVVGQPNTSGGHVCVSYPFSDTVMTGGWEVGGCGVGERETMEVCTRWGKPGSMSAESRTKGC